VHIVTEGGRTELERTRYGTLEILQNTVAIFKTAGVAQSAYSPNYGMDNRVQTGTGAHPASYPMGRGGSFPAGKLAGA